MSTEISNIHEKDKLILEDYFLKKLKLNKIALQRKWDKYYIYRVVESWKRGLMSINAWNSLIKYPQKYRKDKANLIIEEYVEKHKHTYFTIDQIKNYLTSLLPWNGIPSWEYIRKYMRNWLNLSYKRVSWRPKKNLNRDLLIKRLAYTHLIDTIDQDGYILVQIDEFSIGRNIFPSMAWTEKGWSGYALNDTIQNRWSVIAAISNFSFEAVAISKNNTNGAVFVEFLELLIENLKIRFWDKISKIVLSADGARYHSVKELDAVLKKNKMMLIQTIPYTLEFSPIEIFINWMKSKIKKKIRNGK